MTIVTENRIEDIRQELIMIPDEESLLQRLRMASTIIEKQRTAHISNAMRFSFFYSGNGEESTPPSDIEIEEARITATLINNLLSARRAEIIKEKLISSPERTVALACKPKDYPN